MTQTAARIRLLRPTGVERHFTREEIIVSKTDTKGIITYANDIFLRVCAMSEQEVVGQPHNVIRHPDMPRAVFRLMWETIEAGQEIFAYVVNLAADGGSYWVLAHVTPSMDQSGRLVGYHSNRRWVEPEIRREVAAVYATIRGAELRERRTPDAIAAGVTALEAHLARVGTSYEQYVWSLAGRVTAGAR